MSVVNLLEIKILLFVFVIKSVVGMFLFNLLNDCIFSKLFIKLNIKSLFFWISFLVICLLLYNLL